VKRRVHPELLDTDSGTAEEVAAALADIRRVNRWFGGIATSEHLLRRVIGSLGKQRIELLDVASGSGDVPLALARRLWRDGVQLCPMLLDRSAAHLPPANCTVVGDALELPFQAESFDVVSCSLFVHHLEPSLLMHFVSEALRVARYALIINDLLRTRTLQALTLMGRPLFRSPLAWRDGMTSIRRAYTEGELRTMLTGTGRRIEISKHYLQRIGVIVWK
jgi:ubiquinone/menaquinone biosynthesis C-methylase UbiE